jgi:Na+-translocating ferredoxin:NAD+ oxidoreductase RnfC subunit
MTFLGKVFQFQCDYCKEVIYVKQLPQNWYWIKTGVEGGQGHACEKCHHLAPADKKVQSGKQN